jgi:hypothetical protein
MEVTNNNPRRPVPTSKLRLAIFACALLPATLFAQTAPDLRQLLERVESLERANRALTDEVHALRDKLTDVNSARAAEPPKGEEQPDAPGPPLEEQLAIQNQRIAEQAQTKLESAQRFPIRLKGMLLFNSYLNSKQSGGVDYPTIAVRPGEASGGASLRQTIVGLDYQGPQTFGGGKLSASLLMDFYGGSGQALDQALRIRTATMQIDWKTRSLLAGLDKPIFSPRQSDSLAQVGITPLSGAGNLWMWIPQVRFEQDFQWSDTSGLRARLGLVQTRETPSYNAGNKAADELEPTRPGAEGRFEFYHGLGSSGRIEIAPGFHYSRSHVAHDSVPSRVFSMDWLVSPWRKLEFTGAYFVGQNVGHLGDGGISQGFTVLDERHVIPLHSQGGWLQWAFLATDRLSFHLFAGQHDNRDRDLLLGGVGRNLAYGANLFYHLAPNVIVGLEASQVRTTYIGDGTLRNNHYDVAFAYLF